MVATDAEYSTEHRRPSGTEAYPSLHHQYTHKHDLTRSCKKTTPLLSNFEKVCLLSSAEGIFRWVYEYGKCLQCYIHRHAYLSCTKSSQMRITARVGFGTTLPQLDRQVCRRISACYDAELGRCFFRLNSVLLTLLLYHRNAGEQHVVQCRIWLTGWFWVLKGLALL